MRLRSGAASGDHRRPRSRAHRSVDATCKARRRAARNRSSAPTDVTKCCSRICAIAFPSISATGSSSSPRMHDRSAAMGRGAISRTSSSVVPKAPANDASTLPPSVLALVGVAVSQATLAQQDALRLVGAPDTPFPVLISDSLGSSSLKMCTASCARECSNDGDANRLRLILTSELFPGVRETTSRCTFPQS